MLKGYKESLEKAIPDNWEIGILSDVSEIRFSNVDKITSSDEAPILLCNYLDVYNNEYIDDRIEFMPATATDKEIEKFTLKKGDVIITKDSETPDDTAKPAVVVQDLTNVLCGYHLALIRPDSQRVDSVFLGKMLSSKIVNHQFERLAQGLTRFGLEVSSIKNALIAIPPQQEQRKIAEILSTVDEAIEKTDAIIQDTQQLKKGLTQKLFTEGIGHTRFKETKIGRIPEEWEVVSIRGINKARFDFVNPANSPQEIFEYYNIPAYLECGMPAIERGESILSNKLLVTSNTVLFGKLNPRVLKVWLVKPSTTYRQVASTEFLPILPNEKAVPGFIYYLCQSAFIAENSKQYAVGTTPSRQRVNPKAFYDMPFPLPPLPEQHRIVEILSEVDAKIETEQSFKAEREQLKKGLMQVLLTGKVRVKV